MIMKSKLTVTLAAAACALSLNVGAAHATTFDVSATFYGATLPGGCAGCTLGGTITIDTADFFAPAPLFGDILSANITMTGQPVRPFTTYIGAGGES
jgi:hypothetical protein